MYTHASKRRMKRGRGTMSQKNAFKVMKDRTNKCGSSHFTRSGNGGYRSPSGMAAIFEKVFKPFLPGELDN